MFLGFSIHLSYGESTGIFHYLNSLFVTNTQIKNNTTHNTIRGTSGPSRKKGGLTAEAAIASLITMLALLSVLLVFVAMKKQVAITRVMYEACEDVKIYTGTLDKPQAVAAIIADSKVRAVSKGVGNAHFTAVIKDGALHYSGGFRLKIPFFKLGTEGIYLKRTLIIELFDGNSEEEDAHYVYITKYGTVYHEFLTCKHLNITIIGIPASEIAGHRNKNGGKYKPCEYCASKKGEGTVYITPEGDRYHTKKDCRGLLRNIRKVKLSDVIDTHAPCSDCGHLADY
jgi:hypothetical protein